MSADYFIADIPQKALLEHEGKVLLVQDANGKWELPGGRLAVDETPAEGLKREIKEELGADIDPGQIYTTAVFTGATSGNHYVVIYLCMLMSSVADLKVDGIENLDMRWVAKDELATIPIGKKYTEEVLERFFRSKKD
jgi:8-oxo-dGTP pyrophosphatase MutT (NUDIX family)